MKQLFFFVISLATTGVIWLWWLWLSETVALVFLSVVVTAAFYRLSLLATTHKDDGGHK